MDIALSTQLSQLNLADQVGASVARKGLDDQKQEGQNTVRLIESASSAFSDPSLGSRINLQV